MAHHCHATGCTVEVPPEMFMCRGHWFRLPRHLRDSIWTAYRRGQCDDMNPSLEYCKIAKECIIYVAEKDHRVPDTELYDYFLRQDEE